MSAPEILPVVQAPEAAPDFAPQHEEYLRARAVPSELAHAAGLRSVTGEEAAQLLGRTRAIPCECLAIPYPGAEPAYVRARVDNPEAAGARYLAPAGQAVPVYRPNVPLPSVGQPPQLSNVFVVVESPIKALAMVSAGVSAVGLGGTGTTLVPRAAEPRLNDSWSHVDVQGHSVIIVMDAGRASNPNVARDEARLAQALSRAGAKVRLAVLPFAGGGKDQGPDDFIATNGAPALWAILDAAVPAEPVERAEAVATQGATAVNDLLDDLPFRISVLEAGVGVQRKVKDVLAKAGVKTNEWNQALSQAKEQVKAAHRTSEKHRTGVGDTEYEVHDGCLSMVRNSGDDVVYSKLCNFNAEIVEETIRDDGVEEHRTLTLTGKIAHGPGLRRATIEISDFMDHLWPMKAWGAGVQTAPDSGTAAHLRLAIQQQSQPVQRRVYSHTGWRLTRDESGEESGTPVFLHGGGAVGADGLAVELDSVYSHYRLPEVAADPVSAVRASLALQEVAPSRVTVPLLLAVYRASLQSMLYADFSVHLVGQSGSMKTTVAKLFTAHDGEGLADRPVASWADSIAALEAKLFILKDVLVLVDDYKPKTTHVKDEMRVKAHAIISAVGNGEGRGRMRSDGTPRPARPPRGFMLSTDEVLPDGESTLARLLPLHLKQGDVDVTRLTAAQAQAGLLPHARVAYLTWLRSNLSTLKPQLAARFADYRTQFRHKGGHLRSPAALAHLALGAELLASFARDIGALKPHEAQRKQKEWLDVLHSLGQDQAQHASEANPAQRFVEVLRELLAQGKVRLEVDLTQPLVREEMRTVNPVGWEDRSKQQVLLLPEATHREVALAMQSSGEPLPFSPTQLWRRLRDMRLIEKGDREGRHTQRHALGQQRMPVIVMPSAVLFPDDVPPTGGGGGQGPGQPGGRREDASGPDRSSPSEIDDVDFGGDEGGPKGSSEGDGGPTARTTPGPDRTTAVLNRTTPAPHRTTAEAHPSLQPLNILKETTTTGQAEGTGGPNGPVAPGGENPRDPCAVTPQGRAGADNAFPYGSAVVPAGAGPSGPCEAKPLEFQVNLSDYPSDHGGPPDLAGPDPARALAVSVAAPAVVALGLHIAGSGGRMELKYVLPDGKTGLLDASSAAMCSMATVLAHNAKPVLARLASRFDVRPRAVRCTATATRLLAGDGKAAPTQEQAVLAHVPPGDPRPSIFRLDEVLATKLKEAELTRVADLEYALLPVLVELEATGVGMDGASWQSLVTARQHEADALRLRLRAALGIKNPDHDAEVLAALRARGLPVERTARAVLARFAGQPFVADFLRYRQLMAFVRDAGKHVLEALAKSPDGRVRASFDALASPTGRMGCTTPNLLGLPKEADIRRCIVPARGSRLVVADYRAIDLRVLADVTGDKALRAVFRSGGDPHRQTAALLLDKGQPDITEEERRRAKPVNFGFAFGMGEQRFIEYARADYGVEFAPAEARNFKASYLAAYPGVADWQVRVRRGQAREVRSASGRRRCFPPGPDGYTQRLSTEVQGTAADGMKRAMVLLHSRLPALGARMVLPVHDELLVEAPEETAVEVKSMVVAALKEGMGEFVTSVPIEVESSVRATWAEET